jgi:hypothetical protein
MFKEYFLKIVSSNLFQFEIIRVFSNFLCVFVSYVLKEFTRGFFFIPRYGDIPDGDLLVLQQRSLEVLFV